MDVHLEKVTDTQDAQRRRLRKRTAVAAVAVALMLCGLAWLGINRQEASRLGRETRVVVRFPAEVIDGITPDRIEEQFSIEETAGEMEVTGTANATGRVVIHIEPHDEPDGPDDALIVLRVVGETDNDLTGTQSPVVITGDGRGTFEAVKCVHFDGRTFTAADETTVTATHETEILDIEPLPGTPLEGAVRLLASRTARAALPDLNEIAARRIEELVRERVDEMVDETIARLNQLNHFDETVARLHPDSERWRIAVAARDGFVQAALVPEGGTAPKLPREQPTALEVWMRLTRTERTGVNLVDQWNLSQRLLGRFISEPQAQRLADELTVTHVEGWTLLRIGARAFAAESPEAGEGRHPVSASESRPADAAESAAWLPSVATRQ